jgi:hypothetical protein
MTTDRLKGIGRHTAGTRAARTGEWGTIRRILEAGIQISGVTTSK